MPRSTPQPPRLFGIDTGGTFTDALGIDENGRVRRAKVLSTSALRGTIARGVDARSFETDVRWSVPNDFVRGFEFRLLEAEHAPARVARFGAAGSIITLEEPLKLPSTVSLQGAAFEVRSDEEAPVLAARLLTGTPAGEPLPELALRLATTRGTNALLERRGGPCALFITRGFRDLLVIGDQTRPDLFAMKIERPAPVYEEVVEVTERLDARGEVLTPPDLDAVRDAGRDLLDRGIRHAAVALLHAYRNPAHENAVADALLDAGFESVSRSSDLTPTIKILPRARTATVNAYLTPVLARYIARIREAVPRGSLHVMTSAGGLVRAEAFHPKDSLLSGPAGGVTGAAAAGRAEGLERVIGFDMGGTSTDVCRYDGDYEYAFEHRVGGQRLAAPALAIETVAAGGGSICAWRDGRLRVGPESAGASPGPACYGAGGPLAVTDVNLLLNRLDPAQFEFPLDLDAAEARLNEILDAIERDAERGLVERAIERDDLLEGFLQLADERMADAIRQVSLRKGYDVREYALVAFGGAGGQHAGRVAERLGVDTVVFPADASILSAVGLLHAVFERIAERQVLAPLNEVGDEIDGWFEELARDARERLAAEDVDPDRVEIRRRLVHARLLGQETSLALDIDRAGRIERTFREAYEATYGHAPPENKPVEIESLRVVASARGDVPDLSEETNDRPTDAPPEPVERRRVHCGGAWREVPVFDRGALPVGRPIDGPAMIVDPMTTCVVEPGWRVEKSRRGALIARRRDEGAAESRATGEAELVQQDLFMHRFTTIAEEVGRVLERTAVSTNVKERLDFSCALLDASGSLLVNAPHIPVHLGSMGLCVRAVRAAIDLRPGDVAVTNHPAFGGSHLPDVTVVTPVFGEGDALLAYVASRAHHAEIGGTRPGSMPPRATTLAEEGVLIPPVRLVASGEARYDEIERLLREAPFPSRAVNDNLADLAAAVAANRQGARAVLDLAAARGEARVRERMRVVRDRAARLAREALRRLPAGRYEAEERLDDGSPLRVAIDLAEGRATIDFTGTRGTHPGNLNATPAIVTSAVMYVLRLLIGEALPLNEGIMDAVSLNIPPGSMLNPEFPDDPARAPAVVGGNVETSQRLVNLLLKALRVAAASQGTMNNVVFGNERFGYYETIAGGQGAGPGFDGAAAVHTHMTNTRITDPEILEHRYPVRLDRFAIRPDSGGAGAYPGGNGALREFTFLEPVALSVLTQNRTRGPFGMNGGERGAPGRQFIIRVDGSTHELASIDGADLAPGDRLTVETPGGGGWGQVDSAGA